MKTIERDEVFDTVKQFLRRKGIELSEGSYSQTIQKSCRILADVINLGQTGIERAKTGIDQKLDQVRQVIHEKTAPKGGRDRANPDAMKTQPDPAPQAEVEPAPAKAGQGDPLASEVVNSNGEAEAPSQAKRRPTSSRKPKRASSKLPPATPKSKKPKS